MAGKLYWKTLEYWTTAKYFVEDVWKRPRLGYFLVAVAAAMCVRWYFHIPPPSYSVTFMAVAAGLMALRPEMGGREKWLWTMILFAFAWIEIRAISHDREVADLQRQSFIKEERQHFSDIGDGIRGAIAESEQQFSVTMGKFGENVKTITGGDSYAIVWAPLLPVSSPSVFSLILQVRGRYDLQDVHVEVTKLPEPGFGTKEWAARSLSGNNPNVKGADLGNVGHISGKIVPIRIDAPEDGSILEYSINVFARNRTTHESFRIRKNLTENRWESSIKVIDAETHKTLEKSKPEWLSFKLLPPR